MNTLKRDLKIALLLGGPGSEREVSLSLIHISEPTRP